MTDFNEVLDFIDGKKETFTGQEKSQAIVEKINEPETQPCQVFDIAKFQNELYQKSEQKNRIYRQYASNINAYDVAHNCIRQIIYKLTNVPVPSFADKWLPIMMRSTIGSAIHDFIQTNSKQFTETEISVKVPSIRFSGRIDNLINHDTLVEIKSCSHGDYAKILRQQRPRQEDFYQTFVYKLMLENYLDEIKNPKIKTRTNKPKLNKYDIRNIQFVYIAHDVTASDCEDFNQALQKMKDVKKLLNSKSNSFYFMTSLVIDLNTFDNQPFREFIMGKLIAINEYLNNNKVPDQTDPYINKKSCFFCLYRDQCDIR